MSSFIIVSCLLTLIILVSFSLVIFSEKWRKTAGYVLASTGGIIIISIIVVLIIGIGTCTGSFK